MTCVLSSMARRFTSSCARFTEDGLNVPTSRCVDYGFNNGVNGQKPRHENPRCCSMCKTKANTNSVVQYETETSSGSDTNFQQYSVCVTNPAPLSHNKVKNDASHQIPTETALPHGVRHQPDSSEMCNTSEIPIDSVVKHGIKRKLDCQVRDEGYVHMKRVSLFFNTQNNNKEERKKVLKITVKKLRLVVDPDRYLRKAVVMNNTLKKIQRELKEEKKITHKDAYIIADQLNGILTNSCLSLYDDLFFNCGQHEKIANDNHNLSNSLMSNLKDKLCDNTDGCVANSSNTKQSAALVEFSSSLCSDTESYELKTYIENETKGTHQSDKAVSFEQSEKGSQMDTNENMEKMDVNPCSYQLSNIECLDSCFDTVHSVNPQALCDRGGIMFHDTLPSSNNLTGDNSSSIGTYRADSLERDLTSAAIAHLDAIASDSGNLDNFDICHSMDYLTTTHSFFSPSLLFDPIY